MQESTIENQLPPQPRQFHPIILRIILSIVGLILIVLGSPLNGCLRHWAFEETRPIRFRDDARRGFSWGQKCIEQGYFNVYDKFQYDPNDRENWLDYAPLRLGVMALWAEYNSHSFPHKTEYQNTFDFAMPVLWFNAAVELFGAAGMFLLVRHWARRKLFAADRKPNTGLIAAFIAATLLWLSPAALVSAYGWPTWDVWVPAFFIWAIYLACCDFWFLAGVIIGIGALFKGQQLVVASLFILWPIASGSPKQLLYLTGAAIAFLLLRIIFQNNIVGLIAACGLALSVVLIAYHAIRHGEWLRAIRWISGFTFTVAILVSGWMIRTPRGSYSPIAIAWIALMIACAFAIYFYFPKTRQYKYLHALTIGIAILLCIPLFDSSSNWYEYGWRFGTTHFNQLIVGLPNNIPALLTKRFGYYNSAESANEIIFTIPKYLLLGFPLADLQVSLRMLMQSIFVLTLIPCIIAAAGHFRRNDARFLVAIATPWLIFYMIPLQIHERYLLYFAMASACFIVVDCGMIFIHVLTTLFSFAITLNILLNPDRRAMYASENPDSFFIVNGDWLRDFTSSLHPDSGWAMILVLLICIYMSLTPSRSSRQKSAGE